MKTIYYVRHGESEANLAGLASGAESKAKITAKGKAQAKQAGIDLKDKDIELVISSPMIRAMETAEIIAKEIGYDPKKIIVNPLFAERRFGIYSETPVDDYFAAALADKLDESVEPVQDMRDRIHEGFEWLKSREENRIVIVSHGALSRVLRMIHQELPDHEMYKMDTWPNGEIYEFKL
jgi:uncharacterized phosphatase